MKDLSKFEAVKTALSQVVADASVTNGTNGLQFAAHFYKNEYAYDEDRAQLTSDLAKALLNSQLDVSQSIQKKLEALPKPKVIMIWKLLTPIPHLKGTKVVYDGDKAMRPAMTNVEYLYIPEDSVKLGLLEYEETKDMGKDEMGRDAQILNIHLKKGIVDVKEGMKDRKGKEVRKARAYVTAIAFKSMQIAGKIMWSEKEAKRKLYGFFEESI